MNGFISAYQVMNLENWDFISQEPWKSPVEKNDPETLLIKKQWKKGLSKEALLLLEVLFDSPKQSLNSTNEALREMGWKWETIWKTRKEIREHLKRLWKP